MSDVEYWGEVFKDEYLKGCSDEYNAEQDLDSCLERAVESFSIELKGHLQTILREWFDAECETCSGGGGCTYCNGDGECSNVVHNGSGWVHPDDCAYCKGTNTCDVCNGDADCTYCEGTGKAHPTDD